jgi:hypothetical protein
LSQTVEIRAVKNKQDLRQFVMFPYRFYRKIYPNKNWVAPLLVDEKELHDKNRHPFHNHAQVQNFLAYRDGKIVGRISAIKDPRYLEFRKQNAGYFGFFESIDDETVSSELFRTAGRWCAEQGLDKIIGPMNPTPSHILGCLLNDYENPPMLQIPYNPPFYPRLIENAGYQKEEDHFAYIMDENAKLSEKVLKVAEYARRRGNITIRPINLRAFAEEARLVKEIWNDAWEENSDFVPWADDEFQHLAEGLKQILIPDLLFLAYVDGEAAGVSITLPNINEILVKMNGRLLPFGIFRLLFGMKKIKTLRFIGLGIKNKFKNRGIDALFACETYKRSRELGYGKAEFSLILEENIKLRKALEGWGAVAYRTYRVYGKSI